MTVISLNNCCIIRQLPIYLKGRGAQINPSNPFESTSRAKEPFLFEDDLENTQIKTKYIPVVAKSIINKVKSPDVGLSYSLNPYQGCEHGCVYCYARTTHNYWGYSTGLDFETTILLKRNAPQLLDFKLNQKSWQAAPIMFSGNTDCYQPIEKKEQITRKLLEVMWQHRHPLGIVTKNQLILRDLDLLSKMAKHNLVSVAISINTLNDELRHKLEPRTSSIALRLQLIKKLSEANVPVTVLAAPIIPGLNDMDIFPLVKKVAALGARRVSPIVLRLNGDLPEIFTNWLDKNYPERAKKVLNKIASLHRGQLGNSQYGERISGTGKIAEIIQQQFRIACRLNLLEDKSFEYNTSLYQQLKAPQLSLFGQ